MATSDNEWEISRRDYLDYRRLNEAPTVYSGQALPCTACGGKGYFLTPGTDVHDCVEVVHDPDACKVEWGPLAHGPSGWRVGHYCQRRKDHDGRHVCAMCQSWKSQEYV